jgi:hypothetical protein
MSSGQKVLLITVAGLSTRFRATAGRDILKCLYHENDPRETLACFGVYAARAAGFDAVRFVGGYQFTELEAFLARPELRELVHSFDCACIENRDYATKGSCYSLYLGLRNLLDGPRGAQLREIVFMEGDLAVDLDGLRRISRAEGDVFTACRDPITADRAVAVYRTTGGVLRFAYDTGHSSLSIPEPFREIHNSGQVWKFADLGRLREVLGGLSVAALAGTNLEIVQPYFAGSCNSALVTFDRWINCNTLDDYRQARDLLRGDSKQWNF